MGPVGPVINGSWSATDGSWSVTADFSVKATRHRSALRAEVLLFRDRLPLQTTLVPFRPVIGLQQPPVTLHRESCTCSLHAHLRVNVGQGRVGGSHMQKCILGVQYAISGGPGGSTTGGEGEIGNVRNLKRINLVQRKFDTNF